MQTDNIQKLIASWSDEKLHGVFAFNEDGRMGYVDNCACLVGVHSSSVLHSQNSNCDNTHALQARGESRTVVMAEEEYLICHMLPHNSTAEARFKARRKAMDGLLRAEMERRSDMRAERDNPVLEEKCITEK